MSRLALHRLGPLLCCLLPALLLAGCGEEPTPPRLTGFTPAVLSVPANEPLEISVGYQDQGASLEDFRWRVEAGEIEGDGGPAVTYHAPAQPGEYGITVTARQRDQAPELSLESVVVVTRPIATEPAPAGAPPAAATPQVAASEPAGAGPAGPGAPAATTATPERASAATAATATQAPDSPAEAIDRARQALEQATGGGSDEKLARGAPASADTAAEEAGEGAGRGEPAEAPSGTDADATGQMAALTGTDAAAAAGSRLERILERRRLIAVVQIAFAPFSFYGKDGRRTGFEIDFLREFAGRWLGDPNAVTYLPVPSDARISTLQRGRADLIAAALTKTPERAAQVDFSLTYFEDGQRLLVRQSSEVAGVCDLKGRKVAAVEGSTSIGNIQAKARECGFELGDLVIFRRHEDAVQALLAGTVDAFTSDGVALRSAAEGQPLKVVGDPFSKEPYGFAVAKGDARLLQRINATLREMEQDGTYGAIYQRWFGDAIRPYPLGETAAPVAEAAPSEPGIAPAAAAGEPGAGAETADTYVVQPGDTLSRIARKYYGDAWATSWQRIYEANRDVIGDDPGRIAVGMRLDIPK